jgi:hypothetical protein
MQKFQGVLLPDWQQQDAPKHRFTSTSPYGIKFQKTVVFIKKVKAIPLQAWTGPEGSRRLGLPDFKTIGT